MNYQEAEKRMVSFSACAGSAAGKARFSGFPTCEAAVKSGFLLGECMSGCVGVGDCVTVCVKGALRRDNGRIAVDRDKCDGCGDCCDEHVCPQHLIRLVPAEATTFIPCSSMQPDEEVTRATCEYGCIACGECERACPMDAIHIELGHAVIDYNKCVGCMACASVCRKQIIVNTFHDPIDLKSSVAYIRCKGNSAGRPAGNEGKTCAEVLRSGQSRGCRIGCLGCGDCVLTCRFGAIRMENGAAVVDAERCTGCKDCLNSCPQNLIVMLPLKGIKQIPCVAETGDGQACENACTMCGICVENCPAGAIYTQREHAVIDPELCVNCTLCSTLCPEGIIVQLTVPDYIDFQHKAFGEQEGGR